MINHPALGSRYATVVLAAWSGLGEKFGDFRGVHPNLSNGPPPTEAFFSLKRPRQVNNTCEIGVAKGNICGDSSAPECKVS